MPGPCNSCSNQSRCGLHAEGGTGGAGGVQFLEVFGVSEVVFEIEWEDETAIGEA